MTDNRNSTLDKQLTAPITTPSTPLNGVPEPPDRDDSSTDYAPDAESPKLVRYAIIGLGGLGGVIVLSLIIAAVLAAVNGYGLSGAFRVLRDFLIVVLALQGIFISVALVILVIQLASFLNLLRNEVKPLIDELRDTATAARGTARFVSKNVASPMISTAASIAGARAFLGQFFSLRRNTRNKARSQGKK